MGLSIQDYAKKINSRISGTGIISLLITALFLALLLTFLAIHTKSDTRVVYIEAPYSTTTPDVSTTGKPFASSKGKTYTFDWCSGSSVISAKNKIYFASEDEAKSTGRTISKLCKK